MKPTGRGIAVESTVQPVDAVEMTIDPGAMQHIMAVLTDLYSDPEYAVIREYSTNAWDAHIEAGNTDPIEVFLPTKLNPYLRIKDNGVGLDIDDIKRIYSQYGASTKRGTDEQVGMLGLGCKSALTYASQFTVVGRKDGHRMSVLVSRSENGGGTMSILEDTQTDEPDGAEVMVPARKDNELEDKAARLFGYWPEGSVLVNGKPPKSLFAGAMKLTDELYLMTDQDDSYYDASRTYSTNRYTYYYGRNHDYQQEDGHICIMGNVPYPMEIPADLMELVKIPQGTQLVVKVGIGAVNFTPSREALHYTPHTKNTIRRILESYRDSLADSIQREVDLAPDHSAALTVAVRWSRFLKDDRTFNYKGDELPVAFVDYHPTKKDEDGLPERRGVRTTGGRTSYGKMGGYDTRPSIPAKDWPRLVWVEKFEPSDVSADHKRKFIKWADSTLGKDEPVDGFILLHDTAPDTPFIDDARIVSYPDTIRPMKLKEVGQDGSFSHPSRPKGSFFVWDEVHTKTQNSYSPLNRTADSFRDPKKVPVVWANCAKWQGRGYAQQLAAVYDKFTFVALQKNRIDKFKRGFPEALEFEAAIAVKRDEWAKNLTDEQKMALTVHDGAHKSDLQWLNKIVDNIQDPDLTAAIKASMVKIDRLLEQRRVFGTLAKLDYTWSDPTTRYPLVFGGGYYSSVRHKGAAASHVATYINCIYNQEVK